jgi:hypothetical protein
MSNKRARASAGACVLLAACAGLYSYATTDATRDAPYALADVCPRGALVYTQFADLPALVRLWQTSPLKERYLDSTNFRQFQKRHLALKLAERAGEFENALGFALDAATIESAAGNRAAIALYDIGRLEFVFVAPLDAPRAAAVRFLQHAGEFDATELPDGTMIYTREVEADRGRQKQKLLYTHARGSFILATSERLLLRTLDNVRSQSHRDRLSNDPSFKNLTREIAPHFVTVWVDQTKLNDDWYFKHYWAMRNPEELKNIRAGLFDLEIQDTRWIERREFLTSKPPDAQRPALPPEHLRRISRMLPDAAARTHLLAFAENSPQASRMIRDALLDRLPRDERQASKPARSAEYFADMLEEGDAWDVYRYQYLGSEFDVAIDEATEQEGGDEASSAREESRRQAESSLEANLQQSLAAARPLRGATAESPSMSSGPLFVEFRRAAAITLAHPERLSRETFEQSLSGLVRNQLLVGGSRAGLDWTERVRGELRWRELELPALGWKICYALKGRELVVANSTEFLETILRAGDDPPAEADDESPSDSRADDFPTDELTVISFDRRQEAFDRIVETLDAPRIRAFRKKRGRDAADASQNTSDDAADASQDAPADALPDTSQEFFSGNVKSLLDAVSPIRRIEIRRRSTPARLAERVEFILQTSAHANPRAQPAEGR